MFVEDKRRPRSWRPHARRAALALRWLLSVLVLSADASTIKVMMIHNAAERNAGWKEGFHDFFVPFINNTNERSFIMQQGQMYKITSILCEIDLSNDALSKVQGCVNDANAEDVDAIVVGSSVHNIDIKNAAELLGIPNLHCSGGNPLSWGGGHPHAFGLHLPFPWYTRGPLRQASLSNLSTVLIIRDFDSEFSRVSALASAEWSRSSNLRVIGPTEKWCQKWATETGCLVRAGRCQCGSASEFDALGYRYHLYDLPSFYQVIESNVVEAGFDSRAEFLSPKLVRFVEGIIEDVREQGADPDIVVNWLTSARSGLMAMRTKQVNYKMHLGQPSVPGTAWNGYESYWPDGTPALGQHEALYNVGSGQWHKDMEFQDPYFTSTGDMLLRYLQATGKHPTYDAAACVAAGISLVYSLEGYGQSLLAMNKSQRREEIRESLGRIHVETIFGTISFGWNGQNRGRSTVNWQIFENNVTRTLLPVESASAQFRIPAPSWDARLGCPNGTYASGTILATECIPCQEGTYRNRPSPPLEFTQCEPCGPNRGTLPGQRGVVECELCPAGTENVSGICQKCPLGTFRSNAVGGCLPCAAESYADELGMEQCKPCPSNSFQLATGQTYCLCELGTYKDPDDPSLGATRQCLSCADFLINSTTLYAGSTDNSSCICPHGKFYHRPYSNSQIAFCKDCLGGLICPGGRDGSKHQAPLQDSGFAAGQPAYLGAEPPYVIECNSLISCSKGLPLGQCPENSVGKACEACKPDHYDDGGLCKSCMGSTYAVWPLIVALIFCIVVLVIVYKFATKVDRSSRDAVATILFSTGLIVATLQAFPAFSKVEVQWIEPLKTLKGVFAFLTFDLTMIRPGCWMGERNAFTSYLFAILVYPASCAFFCSVLGFAKYVLKKDITLNDLINVNGLILSAVFIALSSLSVRPFKCVGNPDSTSSMANDRGTICWTSGTHQAMVALALVPILGGVLPFMSVMIWAVTQYGRRVARPGGVKFVKRWAFAFARFNASGCYFALVVVLRDFIIGVSPAVFVSFNELLFLIYVLTLASYATLQARIWPWKTSMANFLDSGLALTLVTTVVLGSTLLNFDVARGTVVIQILSMIGFILVSTALLAVIGMVAYRTYKPSKTYGIFLSHHKLGAAVLCRWLKMLLGAIVKDRIFLDSDDVSKLDAIIDVCACDCENVVVIMTSETLKRMWCAAEIAAAWAGHTNIVLVSCDGNGFSQELIHVLPQLWTEEQQATLADSGIVMSIVEQAYDSLLHQVPIELRRRGAKEYEHLTVARSVVSECKGLSLFMLTRLQKTQRVNSFGHTGMTSSTLGLDLTNHSLLMLGDLDTPESGCCCRIIQILLQGKMQEAVLVQNVIKDVDSYEMLVARFQGVRAVLVILTQGMLHHPSFAGALAACPEECIPKLVPVKADESFTYPDPTFFEHLADGRIFSEEVLADLETDFEGVRAIYSRLFNVLALKFSSHGSAHIQATEIMVMTARLLPMLEDKYSSAQESAERASSMERLKTFLSSRGSGSGQAGTPEIRRIPTNAELVVDGYSSQDATESALDSAGSAGEISIDTDTIKQMMVKEEI